MWTVLDALERRWKEVGIILLLLKETGEGTEAGEVRRYVHSQEEPHQVCPAAEPGYLFHAAWLSTHNSIAQGAPLHFYILQVAFFFFSFLN